MSDQVGRVIGVRHRLGRTRDGEMRATQLYIVHPDGSSESIDLEGQLMESDWGHGRFVRSLRDATEEDKVSDFLERHCEFTLVGQGADPPEGYPIDQLVRSGKKWLLLKKVPDEFDGLQDHDTYAMVLGGSGDDFAYMLHRKGRRRKVTIWRTPPGKLADARISKSKDDDAQRLATLIVEHREMFYKLNRKDVQVLLLSKVYAQLVDARKDRIACEQRLLRREKRAFLLDEEPPVIQTLEKHFDEIKASDATFRELTAVEKRCQTQVEAVLLPIDVYVGLFEPIIGMGPLIAARIISAIRNIERFPSKHQLVAYCGAHVCLFDDKGNPLPSDYHFPRRRGGERSNWSPEARQGGYLFLQSVIKNPKSPWNRIYKYNKEKYRIRYPEPVDHVVLKRNGQPKLDDNGNEIVVKKYTKLHIHNMAVWRTVTQFYRWLWSNWRRYNQGLPVNPPDADIIPEGWEPAVVE